MWLCSVVELLNCHTLIFFRFAIIKDEKNQVLTTYVWYRQVK